MGNDKTLTPGTYAVQVECPQCTEPATLLVSLRVVLTVPDDDVASLKIRSRGRAEDHRCGQTVIRVENGTGVIVDHNGEHLGELDD